MAYVERALKATTIRNHSDARIRKGRLSPRSELAGENVIILTQEFIRPQQTPDGRRQDFGGLGPIFKQAIVRGG